MRRDYIAELKQQGKSLRQIAKETGIDHRRLSDYQTGKKSLKSTSEAYEKLRNLNRKTSYDRLRSEGMTARQADKYRRIASSSQTYHHKTARQVQHTSINKTMYQIKMLAEYQEEKTREKRIIESFSKAHADKPDIDEISEDILEMGEVDNVEYDINQEMVNEAIRDAQSKLGGSNWFLVRIIDIEVITYQIG